jgi:integrase
MIHVRQQKTGKHLDIPLHGDLAAAIEATRSEHMTYLTWGHGKPYTPGGFSRWFNDQCRAAGLELGLSAHGLRKAMCRRLAEAGCSATQIMSISGHRNVREIEIYVQAASQPKLAADAMAKMKIGNTD